MMPKDHIKILLVEDNEHDAKQFLEFVIQRKMPYQMDLATSCADALEKVFGLVKYDIILLDFDLGDGTGLDILPAAKQRGVPCIFVAGNSNGQIVMEAIKAGAYDYLVKDAKGTHLRMLAPCIKSVIMRKFSEDLLNRRTEELEQKTKELEAVNDNFYRANKELASFAHIISHDLKAPLRGINNLAGYVLKDKENVVTEQSQADLNEIKDNVKKMDDLIHSILEYSKAGDAQLKLEEINPHEVVDEVVKLLQVPDNIEINIEDKLPTIMYDKTNLFQVFQNLISNAIKYLNKPKGFISISFKDRGDSNWEFSIKDNGQGIKPEYHSEIFEIFESGDAGDREDSTGVGLSIIKKIIQRNKGTIWVDSEIDKGSTFHFTIPKER